MHGRKKAVCWKRRTGCSFESRDEQVGPRLRSDHFWSSGRTSFWSFPTML